MNEATEKSVKVTDSAGLQYRVSDKDVVMDIPEARRQSKAELHKAVAEKLQQLESSFSDRDHKI